MIWSVIFWSQTLEEDSTFLLSAFNDECCFSILCFTSCRVRWRNHCCHSEKTSRRTWRSLTTTYLTSASNWVLAMPQWRRYTIISMSVRLGWDWGKSNSYYLQKYTAHKAFVLFKLGLEKSVVFMLLTWYSPPFWRAVNKVKHMGRSNIQHGPKWIKMADGRFSSPKEREMSVYDHLLV